MLLFGKDLNIFYNSLKNPMFNNVRVTGCEKIMGKEHYILSLYVKVWLNPLLQNP